MNIGSKGCSWRAAEHPIMQPSSVPTLSQPNPQGLSRTTQFLTCKMTFPLLTMPWQVWHYNPFKIQMFSVSELCNCKGWFRIIYTLGVNGVFLLCRQHSHPQPWFPHLRPGRAQCSGVSSSDAQICVPGMKEERVLQTRTSLTIKNFPDVHLNVTTSDVLNTNCTEARLN